MAFKIVFVFPPISAGKPARFAFAPLGVLYLAAFLVKHGYLVDFIDGNTEGYTIEELVRVTLEAKPDLIAISTMTCQVLNAINFADQIRACTADRLLPIICGGAHVSSTEAELFEFCQSIDYLVYGEGEHTLLELAELIFHQKGKADAILGLIYRNHSGKVIANRPRPPIEDLDSLPYPDLRLLKLSKYDSYYAKSLPLTALITSRGCPFLCTFCDAYATHGKRLRFRSPTNVVDEMEQALQQHGIRQFMIKDSTFTVNKQWVSDICSEIIRRKLKINWTCNTRVDMVEINLFKLMKKAGCYMAMFGIESGDQEVLNNIKKGITIDDIKKGINICNSVGMDTSGYFMVGSPGDSEETVRKTINLAKSLSLDYVLFGVTAPYPNTDLYDWAIAEGVLKDRHWYMRGNAQYLANTSISGHLDIPGLPIQRQLELCKIANREFYFRPVYMLGQILKLRPSNLQRKFRAALDLIIK